MSEYLGPEGEESALETLAREAGDLELFPLEVQRLWNENKARKARKALLRAAKAERNPERARLQMQHAGDFRLWLEPLRKTPPMTTLNGVGTKLYGKFQHEPDGTYVSTLWFVLLFIPIWPLSSYLVSGASSGGWRFFARAPRPPAAQIMRLVVIAALVAIAGLGALSLRKAQTHTNMLAYNGFDVPVEVRVGDATKVVAPGQTEGFYDLVTESTVFAAAFQGQDTELETIEVDLRSHASDLVLYNIAGRGLLSVDYVLYGDGTPKEGRWLEGGPVLFVSEKIDYIFREPPETKQVTKGTRIIDSTLSSVDQGAEPVEVVTALLAAGRMDQARRLGLAELKLHPEDASVAWVTAKTTMEDPEEQRDLFRDCIARAPDEVDLHRHYQELWPEDDREGVMAEYQERLAAEPGSAMNQYLVGRLFADDRSTPFYQEALRLDPEFEAVYRALGFRSVEIGDYPAALRNYDRFAGFGPDQSLEVFEDRLRLQRSLGARPADMEALLVEATKRSKHNLRTASMSHHLRLESNPASLKAEILEIDELATRWYSLEAGSAEMADMRADLALTAGDLKWAREELAAFAETGDRAYAIELRLALSDGAAEPDRRRLVDSDDEWLPTLPAGAQLAALELLAPDERRDFLADLGDNDLTRVGHLLEDATALRDTSKLTTAIAPLALAHRSHVYLAAARRLADQGDGAAKRARSLYLRLAREHSLPGELPYLRL